MSGIIGGTGGNNCPGCGMAGDCDCFSGELSLDDLEGDWSLPLKGKPGPPTDTPKPASPCDHQRQGWHTDKAGRLLWECRACRLEKCGGCGDFHDYAERECHSRALAERDAARAEVENLQQQQLRLARESHAETMNGMAADLATAVELIEGILREYGNSGSIHTYEPRAREWLRGRESV